MRFIALLLLVLMACAQVPEPTPIAAQDMPQPEVMTQEEVTSPPVTTPPVPVVTQDDEEEPSPHIEPYTLLDCDKLLTQEEFLANCADTGVTNVVVTSKVGTNNCFINVKDRENERLTAGITLTQYKDGVTAMTEFERRLDVLNVGAAKTIGERVYEFAKADRDTLTFIRDAFIVEVGSDTRLCSKAGLEKIAERVDSHIK